MPQEKEYYNYAGTLVTSRRAVLNGVTYALANITSVILVRSQQKWFLFGRRKVADSEKGILVGTLLLMVGFLCFLIISSYSSSHGSILSSLDFKMIFITILIIALYIYYLLPSRSFVVQICSSSGEVDALEGKERPSLEAIVRALNQAIVEHQ